MALPPLGNDEKEKLRNLIDEGVQVEQDVADMKEGLRETVKAVCEELDLDKATINKAIKAAYKANLQDSKDQLSDVEDVLKTVNRG